MFHIGKTYLLRSPAYEENLMETLMMKTPLRLRWPLSTSGELSSSGFPKVSWFSMGYLTVSFAVCLDRLELFLGIRVYIGKKGLVRSHDRT